jgi:group I intron endonuclease
MPFDRSAQPTDAPHVFRAYLVTNRRNGKQYIGVIGTNGKTVEKRWREHCYEAAYDSHYLLHKAIRKYGATAFEVGQIASARTLADILAVERLLIVQYGTLSPKGYNLTSGGEGVFEPAEETRAKMRAFAIARGISPEMRQRALEANLGSKRTLEQRQRIGDSRRGKKRNPLSIAKATATRLAKGPSPAHRAWSTVGQRGRKASDETRAKMSTARTGQKRSEETKARMRAAWDRRRAEGKVNTSLSPEHRAKIAAAGMGRITSEATKAKIAAKATGRKATPETRAILVAAWVKRRQDYPDGPSPEARAKMSVARKGRKRSAETRAKMSQALTGRKFSAEHRANISAAKKGKPRRTKR